MTRSMTARRMRGARRIGIVLALVALSLAAAGGAAAHGTPMIDPSDPRLVPDPIANSDEGTTWACRVTGSDVACIGTLKISWDVQEGPGDWCGGPLYSLDGTFSRNQTRFYTLDAASGLYLEYKRLIHLDAYEYFTPTPDPNSTNFVEARLSMTWLTTFQTPGDLDSRSTQKQGIDTFVKPSNGGVIVLDIGQKTEDLTIAPGEDFDFRGRWDGDPVLAICSALGL